MNKPIRKRKPNVRLNLTLSQDAKNRLEKLQRKTDADTLTEVIRRAIKLYDRAVDIEKAGGQLIVRSDAGEREILVL